MARLWIREKLQRTGHSQVELARHLGLDASAVSRLVKGERQLKSAEAQGIADFVGSSVEEVFRAFGIAPQAGHGGSGSGHASPSPNPGDGFVPRLIDVPQPAEMRQMAPLPVYGSAIGGVDGAFELNGQVNELVDRPPQLAGVKNAYGVYVAGDSMVPVFRPGWLLHVNPNRPLTPGCGTVIQLHADHGEAPLCYIKEFIRRTPKLLVVRQYNPQAEIEWPLDRVIAAHRIVGIAEM